MVTISWVLGSGKSCRGGSKKGVSWLEVEATLLDVRQNHGSVRLDLITEKPFVSKTLQVEMDSERFLLSLGVTVNNNYELRTLVGYPSTGRQVNILGNMWDESLTTREFSFVVNVFKEFFEGGDVSRTVLN